MIKSSVSKQGDLNMAFDKNKYDDGWKKENTVIFSVRLFKSTDADIIEEMSKHESKASFLKMCAREYIANHKEQG